MRLAARVLSHRDPLFGRDFAPKTFAKTPGGLYPFFNIRLGNMGTFRLFQRAADDFGLGDLPAGSETFETVRSRLVQGERGAMSHGGHTITHTIGFEGLKVNKRKG